MTSPLPSHSPQTSWDWLIMPGPICCMCTLNPRPLQPVQFFTLLPPLPWQAEQMMSRVAASFRVCNGEVV